MKTRTAFFTLPHYNPAGHLGAYESLEVHTVLDTGEFAEALAPGEDLPGEDEGKVIWSLYGYVPGAGVETIGDFSRFEDACDAALRLGGVPLSGLH